MKIVFRSSQSALVGSLLAVLSIVGCGSGESPPLVSVQGKMVDGGGKPVCPGTIYFLPHTANSFQKDTPSGMLQLDGSCTMKTFPFGEGVPPGRYKVILAEEVASRMGFMKYSKPGSTPWSIEVADTPIEGHVLTLE